MRHGDRGAGHPGRGALSVARRHQGEGDRQRGPRGGLHRRGETQGQARQGDSQRRPRLAGPQQGEAQADQGQHGQVVPARAERERDDGRGRDHRRPQPGPRHAAHGQGDGESEHEHHAEPQPRIGQQAATEEGVRDAEHGQGRQVRVVDVRVVRGGHRVRALIRRAVVQEQFRRVDDHADFRLSPPGPRHPGQRDDHGPDQAECGGDPGSRPPGQRGDGRDTVRARRQDAPQPLWRVGAEDGHRAGEQRRHGQQDGGPGRCGGPGAPLPDPLLASAAPLPPGLGPPPPPRQAGEARRARVVAGVAAWQAGQR